MHVTPTFVTPSYWFLIPDAAMQINQRMRIAQSIILLAVQLEHSNSVCIVAFAVLPFVHSGVFFQKIDFESLLSALTHG